MFYFNNVGIFKKVVSGYVGLCNKVVSCGYVGGDKEVVASYVVIIDESLILVRLC